jgi:hypothetical protein
MKLRRIFAGRLAFVHGSFSEALPLFRHDTALLAAGDGPTGAIMGDQEFGVGRKYKCPCVG